MAPNVTSETLYFARHNDETESLAAFTGWVNDRKGPLQGSASFGECENVGNAGAVLADGMEVPGDKVLEQAVVEGRTLFSCTGDTGASCPIIGLPVIGSGNGLVTQLYPGLEWPSVSPWAVAVGGTDLTSDGNEPAKRLTETAWEDTGGGNSTSEPAGSYQIGVASTNCAFDPNGNPYVPVAGAAGPICRSTPDVASLSGDVATGNGLLINNDSGADQQGAGTSLSSPLWLGMWTRIQAAAAGKGLGFANYKIYKLAQSSAGRDFYDVTVGDNQPYPAKPGYDNASGWGTPEVSQIMQDLTGRLTPTHNTPPAPIVTSPSTTCGSLFTDAAGDDNYAFGLGAGLGASPQLDILSGRAFLSADGQTLRTIITVKNLSTVIPTGGVENDYQMVFTFGGNQYFTQLAVEQTGTVLAWDGQLVKVSLENKYLQEHAVTGTITLGPNGTAEVDAPIADFPGLAAGTTLLRPSAATYVREGVNQGPLEPADSAGPTYDDILGTGTSWTLLTLAALAVLAAVAVPGSGAATAPTGEVLKPFCTTGVFRCMSALRVDLPVVANATAAHSGLGPADLRKAYELASAALTNGKGQTVALVDAYDDPTIESDLNTYRAYYGIPPCTTANGCFRKVNQDGEQGNYPIANPAGSPRSRSTPRWSRRSARSATSCSSRRTRPTRRPSCRTRCSTATSAPRSTRP